MVDWSVLDPVFDCVTYKSLDWKINIVGVLKKWRQKLVEMS